MFSSVRPSNVTIIHINLLNVDVTASIFKTSITMEKGATFEDALGHAYFLCVHENALLQCSVVWSNNT